MTVLALGLLLFAASLDQDDRAVGLGEGGLRRSAIMAPTPEYPRASHRPGAINVPYDEIGVRAPHELDPKKLHVIDCTRDQRPICNIAHDMLKESGFARLAILVRR